MDTGLLIVRLSLAVVFAVAGITKLADLAGSRQSVHDFGLPSALVAPLGILLPLAELSVAIALLAANTAWWGAFGAFALLTLFIVGISANLARGRQPDCHCFGQLHSSPVSWKTLVRNTLLAALAVFILWQGRDYPGPGVFDWTGTLTVVELISLLVAGIALGIALIMGWFLLHVLQQQGRMLLRIEILESKMLGTDVSEIPRSGLPVGTQAPAFQLFDLAGVSHTLDTLRSDGKPVILLFSNPSCGPCTALMPHVAIWQKEYAPDLTLVVISQGPRDANQEKNTQFDLKNVLLQKNNEVAEAYQCYGTPSAILLRSNGTIGSHPAMGAEAIEQLIQATIPVSLAV